MCVCVPLEDDPFWSKQFVNITCTANRERGARMRCGWFAKYFTLLRIAGAIRSDVASSSSPPPSVRRVRSLCIHGRKDVGAVVWWGAGCQCLLREMYTRFTYERSIAPHIGFQLLLSRLKLLAFTHTHTHTPK